MKKIALLFAGQGAQVVGMGRDLAEQFPVAAELFRQADEILGRKLSEIAWNGPIEELTKTSNCQPALYVHGLAGLAGSYLDRRSCYRQPDRVQQGVRRKFPGQLFNQFLRSAGVAGPGERIDSRRASIAIARKAKRLQRYLP